MGRYKSETSQKVIRLWELGFGDDEIAEKLGMKEASVKTIRNSNGCTNGREITYTWLTRSGVGDKWDEVCARFRR